MQLDSRPPVHHSVCTASLIPCRYLCPGMVQHIELWLHFPHYPQQAHLCHPLLYVMVSGFTCRFCSCSILSAAIHCWPFSHELLDELYVMVLGFTCNCFTCSILNAAIHCWPFSHELPDELYVMVSGFTCHFFTCSILNAAIHCWPFSHELPDELYVMVLGFTCHFCTSSL